MIAALSGGRRRSWRGKWPWRRGDASYGRAHGASRREMLAAAALPALGRLRRARARSAVRADAAQPGAADARSRRGRRLRLSDRSRLRRRPDRGGGGAARRPRARRRSRSAAHRRRRTPRRGSPGSRRARASAARTCSAPRSTRPAWSRSICCREINLGLRPRLLTELRPGARIVSHAFDMGDWRAEAEEVHDGRRIFLWIVPAVAGGSWALTDGGRRRRGCSRSSSASRR